MQIERDLARTDITNDPLIIDGLRRLLKAYCASDKAVGYCQGMNSIGAMLLLHLCEEESFWALHVIASRVLPRYFCSTLAGVHVDVRVLGSLVASRSSELWEIFSDSEFEMDSVATTWLMTGFVNTLQLSAALRLWDVAFSLLDFNKTQVGCSLDPRYAFIAMAVAVVDLAFPDLDEVEADMGFIIFSFQNFVNQCADSIEEAALFRHFFEVLQDWKGETSQLSAIYIQHKLDVDAEQEARRRLILTGGSDWV